MRYQRPTSGSSVQVSYMGKISSQNIWLWRPVGLTFRRATGLWEIDTPLIKGAHKIAHTWRPRGDVERVRPTFWSWRAFWKGGRQFRHTPMTQTGDTDSGRSRFRGLVLPRATGAGKQHFTILPPAYWCQDPALPTGHLTAVLWHPRSSRSWTGDTAPPTSRPPEDLALDVSQSRT